MTRFNEIHGKFLLICFCIIQAVVHTTSAADVQRTQILPSPIKQTSSSPVYAGIELNHKIPNIRVSSCVSLGGSCIDHINNIMKEADEFVVTFMYRFNSPTLMRTLEDKYHSSVPVVVFLDFTQTYDDSLESQYTNYVQRLIESVPTSIVKLGSRAFHQKVIISKKAGEQAITTLGSANATYEADNEHSEDILMVQSNELASIYLEEFEKLLRMEPVKRTQYNPLLAAQQVMVFHEHRRELGKSNTDLLPQFKTKLLVDDKMTRQSWHVGDVVSLAISTGFPDGGGSQRCLNTVNRVLESEENKLLLLFENFISLDEGLHSKTIWNNLNNKTPKLIVVDADTNNQDAASRLNQGSNKTLMFRPFTRKKFHHKAIIEFLKEAVPIVFSGSFHISTNAINRNSETTIGIQSPDLADEYLSAILLNSGLGERPEIWLFAKGHAFLRKKKVENKFVPSQMFLAAEKLLRKCQFNMNRYLDRLERIEEHLLLAASDAEQQIEIENACRHFKEQFLVGQGLQKLQVIEKLKESVFEGTIRKIYLQDLTKQAEIVRRKFKDLEELPVYSKEYVTEWLEKVGEWLEEAKEEYKLKKQNHKPDLESMENIHRALSDLYDYEHTFSRLETLEYALKQFLGI